MDIENKLTVKDVMQNNDLNEFVSIETGLISDTDKEEIVNEIDLASSQNITRRVNLVQMAYLHVQGYDNLRISQVFGVTQLTISQIKTSEKFKSILNILTAEIVATARTFLTTASLKATLTLLKCMDSKDDRTRLKAATEVMDRIGLNAPKQLEIIQKGDKISGMDENELLDFIKMGMKEIKPIIQVADSDKGVVDNGDKFEIAQSSES